MSEKESKIVEVQEKLNDITECSICAETFKDPKILSCVHTFCKNCLQELATKLEKSVADEIPCPICRKKFLIPDEGFDGLQKNFFMENLIEMKSILNPSSNRNVCEACLDEDPSVEECELPVAEFYCSDCKQKLCKECHKCHLKIKLSKNHKVLNLNELQESVQIKVNKFMPGFCDKHGMQPLNIFCSDCMDAVCAICFFDDHKSHEGSAVDSVVDDFRNQIQENVDDLKRFIPDLQQKEKKLADNKAEFTENLNKLEIEIMDIRDELKAIVDAHSASLLSELNAHRETSLKNLESSKDDIQTLQISLDSFETYCNKIITAGSSISICKAIGNLSNRAIELKTSSDYHSENIFQFRHLQLSKSLFSAKENIIGELKAYRPMRLDEADETIPLSIEKDQEESADDETTETERIALDTMSEYSWKCNNVQEASDSDISDHEVHQHNLVKKIKDLEQQVMLLRGIALGQSAPIVSPGSINYKKVTKIQGGAEMFSADAQFSRWAVKGLDILGSELFIVVDVPNPVFQVYDLKNFQFKRRWTNERLIEVKHIKSCSDNECLYLLASVKKDIKEVKVTSGNNEIIRCDPNGLMIKCWSVQDAVGLLSITNEANVLFVAWNINQIQEFTPEGQLLHAIALSWNFGFDHLWHAIKLNSSHYVVCHGTSADSFQRICIIDSEGKVLHCAENGLRLSKPSYMEKDKDNNIVIIDYESSRLIVLTSNLETINSTLYLSPGYMYSARVDESNRRLFVVETPNKSQPNVCLHACKISALILDTELAPS